MRPRSRSGATAWCELGRADMLVDFHVHSTASDGTLPPAELAARGARFAALALTDHDNCDGVEAFLGAPPPGRCRRVAGIELSIDPGRGFDRFHLLGLGVDPGDAGLLAFLRRILDGRRARNVRILGNFRRLEIDMEDPSDPISGYAHGAVLARPHFAKWLVRHGHAPDPATAFARYLQPDSPVGTRCYEERWHPSQEDAFRVVHAAGGLCVMAHPRYWRDAWKTTGPDYDAAERELAALKERGLDGVEALYQANTPQEDVEFTRMAMRLGLLTTAGSDFHGAHKPTISLGMEVSAAFIGPFLERLGETGGRR